MENILFDAQEYFGKASSPDCLGDLLTDKLGYYGIERFCYVGMQPPRVAQRSYAHTTFPKEWLSRYVANDYLFYDPMMHKARRNILPFGWGGEFPLEVHSTREQQIIEESTDFGHTKGLSFPVRGNSGEFACLVAIVDDSRTFREMAEELAVQVQILTMQFHYKLWNNLRAEEEVTNYNISSSQVEILRLASIGKSAWEISQIMNTSEANIKYHIRECSRKLGAIGVTATVSKAIAMGLVSP